MGGGLTLTCLLKLDGAFSVDRTRFAYPAIPFVWHLVLDDAKAGGMAPASARVAADGEAVVVGEATDAVDGLVGSLWLSVGVEFGLGLLFLFWGRMGLVVVVVGGG